MSAKVIDAELFASMFLAGAQNLDSKKEWINELNVFPVPDGDTGTNMTLTIMSAAKEVQALQEVNMKTLAKAITSGSLRGARGNSGVILSQLLRGFTKEIENCEVITPPVVAAGLKRATETAYKAVMKPKEGTILTVAKGMADKAAELCETTDDFEEFFRSVIDFGDEVLAQTPDMLPVLKQAGVVDSGGQGLMQVMKGALDGYLGNELDLDEELPTVILNISRPESGPVTIKYGYCTEFIINLDKKFTQDDEFAFKDYLLSIGDSLVCVAGDDLVKVHVHTNDPGLAIQKALTYGPLTRMKIDNMREEHQERLFKDVERLAKEQLERDAARKKAEKEKAAKENRKETGFIAVSAGAGLAEIFRGLNVDFIVEGGQSMNPSTEDFLDAFDKVNADTIYVYPNNKNIVLAAEQAAKLTEDKNIVVVPSKTIPQGITAIINYIPTLSAEDNLEGMKEEMKRVKTGQITYAVRDTEIDGFVIRENDIMGVGDSGILAAGTDRQTVAIDMLAAMMDDESELVSIYYGADVAEDEAEALLKLAEEKYPDADMELHPGGQPVYYYIISAE